MNAQELEAADPVIWCQKCDRVKPHTITLEYIHSQAKTWEVETRKCQHCGHRTTSSRRITH